jgi:hypothetical protein
VPSKASLVSSSRIKKIVAETLFREFKKFGEFVIRQTGSWGPIWVRIAKKAVEHVINVNRRPLLSNR